MKFSKSLFFLLFFCLFLSNLYCSDDPFKPTITERFQIFIAHIAYNALRVKNVNRVLPKRFLEKVIKDKHGHDLASDFYQRISEQAQERLGIPLEKRLMPLRCDNLEAISKNTVAFFSGCPNSFASVFHIKEKKFLPMSYGVKKHFVFHELVHYKQFLSCSGNFLVDRFPIINPTQYRTYESEADLEAVKNLDCKRCMEEFATLKKNCEQSDDYATFGETYAAAVQAIYGPGGIGNKACDYHRAYDSDFFVRYRKPIISTFGLAAGAGASYPFYKLFSHYAKQMLFKKAFWALPAAPVGVVASLFAMLGCEKYKKNILQRRLEDKIASGELKT